MITNNKITIEEYMNGIISDSINMTIPWYLMASYAYYVEDNPIISDSVYDELAKKMLDNWDIIDHRHKSHISKDMLSAGTYLGEYPPQVEESVEFVREMYGRK